MKNKYPVLSDQQYQEQCAHRLWPGTESPSLSSTPVVVPVAARLREGSFALLESLDAWLLVGSSRVVVCLGLRVLNCREVGEDGKELTFDHGAPFFSVTNSDAMALVHEWESRGFVSQWKQVFGSFDCASNKFLGSIQQVLFSILPLSHSSLSLSLSLSFFLKKIGRGCQQQQVCGCSRHELYIKGLVQPVRYVSFLVFLFCGIHSALKHISHRRC